MVKIQLYGFTDFLTGVNSMKWLKKDILNTTNELAMAASKLGVPSLSSNQFKHQEKIFVILKPEYLGTVQWNSFKFKPNAYQSVCIPEIKDLSINETESWERCPSFPGLQMKFLRSDSIKVKYITPLREQKEEEIKGFRSILFQHEVQHTIGNDLLHKALEIRIIDETLKRKHNEVIMQRWSQFCDASQSDKDITYRALRRDLMYRIIDHYR